MNVSGKGGFQKGRSGNPNGRPKREREEQYRSIMLAVVTPERWIVVCEKAVTQAEKGDATARKWLSDYLIGPPVQKSEITGKDDGEIIVRLIRDES